ncbi:MAG: SpoIID/LytB domain-containing protein [Actinobacteria bacterium]|nr:SpoIID/LytB domain-containing protein [Actinomycetota bacterium]
MRLFRPLAVAVALSLVVAAAPATAARNRELGAAVAPIRLVPRGSTAISVAGLHSYFGSVELASAGDGLVVSNRISLERYLLGLQEVPTEWPEEALKAQVVAARTYALWTLAEGRTGEAAVYGYDICATVQCQVFSGADVVRSPNGERWRAAVEATAGQAILYDDKPILARYHSTSGGMTLDNEDAFSEESAYPYLKSVESPWEEDSPLYRWRTTFRLRELEAIIRRAGWWSGKARLERVYSVPSSSGLHYPDVVFEGGARRLVRTAEELREVVRDVAPAMFPGRYPGPGATTSGVLPETFPSNRLEVRTDRKRVVVDGRGWGHGSGMSQWGAYGLAQRGATYTDILTHYYTGVSIGSVPEPPPFEVGVQAGVPSVRASGFFEIVDGRGKTIVPRALGTWTFRWAGAGAVAIEPPAGFGLPLEVGIVDAPKKVLVGEPAFLTVALSRPARVRTRTADSPTGYRDPGVEIKDAGRREVVWLAPLEEGLYRVRVQARAGPTERMSEPVEILVTSASMKNAEPRDPGDDARGREDAPPVLVVAIFAALILLAVGAVVRAARRGEPPQIPPSD